jgi:hypothetical protein
MRKTTMLMLTTLVVTMSCSGWGGEAGAQATEPWTFEMEKVWEIQKIGEDQLLRPAEPRVAEDGTLYFRDFERKLSYIIDPNGKLVGTFAAQGGNEGEVSFYLNCFPAGDYVVICAPDKLHFFTKQGKFVKAVPNNVFVRFPLAFKDENEFWVAPGALGDAPGGKAAVTHVNLASGQETTVHEFKLTDEEKKPSGGAMVVGLTPQPAMSFDRQLNLICFGKNSDTVIYWLPAGGGEGGSFAFTGTRPPVSEADKRNHVAKFGIPEERIATMVGAMPDKMTYYNRMQIVDGLIYLLRSESFGHAQRGQLVDVLAPDGQQLYHGQIQVEQGWQISNPDNLRLVSGFVYTVLENDAGAKKVVKYKVALPRP